MLKDAEHPYCGTASDSDYYDSADAFLESVSQLDQDLNLLYRWDYDKDEYSDNPEPYIEFFYIQQRRGRIYSSRVKYAVEDEPKLREYIEAQFEYLKKLWSPVA